MRVTLTIALALVMIASGVVLAQEAEPAAMEDRVEENLLVLYHLANVVEETIVPDLTQDVGGLDLVIRGGEITEDGVQFDPADAPESVGLFSTEVAAPVFEGVRASGQLTVEAWVTPAADDLTGPARIVSISRGVGERNLTLGQQGDAYALRLRTSATNHQGMPDLRTDDGTLVVGELQHIVATFDGEATTIYLNGEAILESDDRAGTLENWDEMMLLMVGNETSGDRPWAGSVHLVALYGHALSPDQVRANFDAGL